MKKKLTLLAAIIACNLLCLTSCEKHDGINYLKSKCTAELNGQTYIDQQPYTHIFGPMRPTPFLEYNQYLFVDTPEEFIHQPQTIEKIDIANDDTLISDRDYRQYCKDNKVSYATVNGEVIDEGTFQITSYDKNEGQPNCYGTFTLQFSEGTLKGEFYLE